MSELETLLQDSLSRSAGRAPAAPHDLLQRVDAAARRRRRRGTAVAGAAAAAAVVAVTMTGFFVTSSLTPARPAEPAAPATASGDPQPLRKVWPQAVHTLPRTLPDGRPYQVERFLDRDTLLVRTTKDGNPDRPDGLWSYNVKSGALTRLVAVQPPKGTVVSWPFTAAGEGRLVWWTLRKDGARRVTDIWAAPVKGGAQRRVTSFESAPGRGEIGHFAVAEGKVVWSLGGDGGLYEAPLSGGAPRRIGGTEGLHLLGWPWAAAFQYPRTKKQPEPPFGELVNVLTGERRAAPAISQDRPVNCGITWCVAGERALTRDGSRERLLSGRAWDVPAMDRFVLATKVEGLRLQHTLLYDLATGRAGDLGIRAEKRGGWASPTLDRRAPGVFAYELDGKLTVVDLTIASR
ncbi:hypothetical protein [Nonomuraea sp. NPDC003754]